jgi:hypothetical protein
LKAAENGEVIDRNQMAEEARKGIPDQIRGDVWMMLTNAKAVVPIPEGSTEEAWRMDQIAWMKELLDHRLEHEVRE